MKLHIVNVHHIRKTHYRRCVAIMLFTVTAAHLLIPDHEHWVSLAANLVWLFDPTEA